MALHPGAAEILASAPDGPSVSGNEDLSKKVRKPYTITKSRESWTEQEHDKFLEALQLFDRDWKKIEAFVGSKTVIQIRSHAQKYFLKVQKNGTGEHVPPPRPKRKSAQPYPQKASKSTPATHQGATSMSLAEPGYPVAMQPVPPVSSASAMPAWVHHMAPPASVGFINKGIPATGIGPMGPPKDQNGTIIESSAIPSQKVTTLSQGSGEIVLRAMPDFTEIYSFLGSVFDPTANGQLERMREMAPIDRETVLLLMRNLSINLSSSDFEEHKLFLSVYDMEPGETLPSAENVMKGLAEETLPSAENVMKGLAEAPAASQPPLDGGDDTIVSGNCELREVSESVEAKEDTSAGRENTGLRRFVDKPQEDASLQRHLNEELTSSTRGVLQASDGKDQSLPLLETPLFMQQSVCETSELVKLASESEDDGAGGVVDPFDAAAEPDDSKSGAEIVDMWWS